MNFNLMNTAGVTMERETFPSDETRDEANPEGEKRRKRQICRQQINTEVKKKRKKSAEEERSVWKERTEMEAEPPDLQPLIGP